MYKKIDKNSRKPKKNKPPWGLEMLDKSNNLRLRSEHASQIKLFHAIRYARFWRSLGNPPTKTRNSKSTKWGLRDGTFLFCVLDDGQRILRMLKVKKLYWKTENNFLSVNLLYLYRRTWILLSNNGLKRLANGFGDSNRHRNVIIATKNMAF